MDNKTPCGECLNYYPLEKPKMKGGTIPLHMGHCLKQTIYASNRPNAPEYPPGARVEELPYGQHLITVVRESELRPHCNDAKQR